MVTQGRQDDDFDREVQAHLEMETERLREEGLSEAEARATAHRAFGNVTKARERFYESRRIIWLEQLVRDVRLGARLLRKSPGFAAATILTLAIGIGANTAMFSVVDAYLLRPAPYPDSGRLITVWTRPPQGGHLGVAAGNFLDIQAQSRSFEHMGVLAQANFHLSTAHGAERLSGFRVSADFLRAIGVSPGIGRDFARGEDRPGAAPVAILSYAAWQGRFGGDPGVVGRPITLDGQPCTVIGVMPETFRFAFSPEIWAPLEIDPAGARRDIPNLVIFGKLRPDRTLRQAQAEVQGILVNLARAYPQAGLKGWSADLVRWHDELSQYHRDSVVVLFGAVGLVLLIACVNVANLLLARAAARHRELAVRASMGAGRARLIRQMLAESALMAGAGGAAGILLARVLTPWAATLIEEPFRAGLPPIGIDVRALAFTLAISLFAGLLFGLLPAWRASRIDLHSLLKDTGRTLVGGSGGRHLRFALVVVEVALALMLLIGAGLLARTLAAYSAVDPGFRAENVLSMRVVMPEARYTNAERLRGTMRRLLDQSRAIPGVRAACLASFMPLDGSAFSVRFQTGGQEKKTAPFQTVSDGYFETLGIRLRGGRVFEQADHEGAPRVVIVNESFVKRFLAGKRAIGERLMMEQWRIGQAPAAAVPWAIIGVVADVKVGGLGSAPLPLIYAPVWQQPAMGGVLAVRTESDAAAFAPLLRAAVRAVDDNLAIVDVRTLRQMAFESVAQPRMRAGMAGAFAAVALILAALGIYGVVSYSVAQSTQEMGIRMALGAQPRQVVWSTLRRAVVMVGFGLAIGLAGALALTRALKNLLFAVQPTDPATYVVLPAVLMAVALVAAYLPARRAARVDAAAALRWE